MIRQRVLAGVATVVLVAAGAVAGGGPAWGAGGHARIEGTGSSWAANAMNQYVAAVATTGLQVTYTSTGSSSGRKDFAAYANDFAVTDLPFQGADPVTGQNDTSNGRPFGYVPIVAGGTAFPYQLRVNGTVVRDLRLSGETLLKIFTGRLTDWSDPAITADNGGRQLPSLAVIPVVHAEGSGTTWHFTRYLAHRFPAEWAAFTHAPAGPTSYFPPVSSPAVSVNGSDGVMNTVTAASNNGAIGYDEYSYALAAGWPVAKVRNAAGAFTLPVPEAVTIALQRAAINVDPASPDYLTADLSEVYASPDARAYPLSSYSYVIMPTGAGGQDSRMNTQKRQTLADFLAYALCSSGSTAALGHAVLPANLVRAGFDQVRRLHAVDPAVEVSETTTCPVGPQSRGVPVDGDNQTEPYQGTVALQVAGGTAVHLRQLDPAGPGGHPAQATDPTGHRHACGSSRATCRASRWSTPGPTSPAGR
jgi:phosphate ABC transporter phosphate-binding protein